MSQFRQFLESFDAYGVPVTVNYKGSDVFKTPFGGIVSIISSLLVLGFAITKFEQLVTRASPNVTTTTEFVSYHKSSDKYNLKQHEFEAMIRVENMSGPKTTSHDHISEKYGRIVAHQVSAKWPLEEKYL